MATRSRIGIEMPDHSVISVYCHWDGYPENNGKILVEHYLDRDKVQKLIDGGGISILRTRSTWDTNEYLKDENGKYLRDENGFYMHKDDRDPQPLYYAERGEEVDVQHTSFDEFVSGNLGGEEYAYLFDLNDNWKAYSTALYDSAERVEIPNYVTA